MIAAGWPTWAYLDPTWTQVGSKLAQVGPMLAPSWLQLGSSWVHVGPRSGSPAAPEPTQALPNPFPVASEPPKLPFVPYKIQHRPQKSSKTSNLDLPNPQLGPQKTSTRRQKTPPHPPLPRPGGMGRSLFNIISDYIILHDVIAYYISIYYTIS